MLRSSKILIQPWYDCGLRSPWKGPQLLLWLLCPEPREHRGLQPRALQAFCPSYQLSPGRTAETLVIIVTISVMNSSSELLGKQLSLTDQAKESSPCPGCYPLASGGERWMCWKPLMPARPCAGALQMPTLLSILLPNLEVYSISVLHIKNLRLSDEATWAKSFNSKWNSGASDQGQPDPRTSVTCYTCCWSTWSSINRFLVSQN